jgi:glycosyltransferase involved in cell wall biosynthesis
MKDYKKVNISEIKAYEESSLCSCSLLKVLIILISIIIITSVICIYFYYENNTDDKIYIQVENNSKNTILGTDKYNEIKSYEKSLREITKSEMAEFRQINNKGLLYDRTKYPLSETPDVSIITTIYNQAHCIHKAIRSVQNQSLKNIEMIIIDDCSRDNSTETVESFMKEDDRIILIKKDINEGIMITRNKAIKYAKGRYICILDADDTLAHKDILKYSVHIADLGNLDVVEFYTAYYKSNVLQGYYHFHGNNKGIIYQPELKTKFYELKDTESFRAIKCRTVWGKIVKNDVFQKTLNFIPKKYSNDYILGFEDTMITVSLYNVAQSYYLFRQPGYYYTFDERKGRFPLNNAKKCEQKEGIRGYDHLKFLQFLIDIYEDNEFYKQVIYHELKAINNYTYSNFKRTIKDHFRWTYDILDELLNSKYIYEEQKTKIKKIRDEVKSNEIKK